ncbi:hypothetical protein [Gordonia terrae]
MLATGCSDPEWTTDPSIESHLSSTAVTGTGGTPADYGEIRLVIELSVDAMREDDKPAFDKTQCARFRPSTPAPSGPDRYSGVFNGLNVERVEDIDVKGATATAKLTTKQGEQLRTQTLSLVREADRWVIC